MRLSKRLIATVLLGAGLLLGSRASAADSKLKIGLTMASFEFDFHQAIMAGAKKWADAHNVTLVMVDAHNDMNKQLGQVENFFSEGIDGVIVQAVDGTATGPMSKAAIAAKKPLVYLNRLPADLPKGVLFAGSKSIDSGIFEMEELGRIMNGKGNIVILLGELSNEATHARVDGVKKVIKEKYPSIKVTREQTANWKRDEGRTIMENWLASGDKIDGVASNNDEMALGAIMAIKAAGKLGKIPVCGIDAEQDALDSMEKGELDCTVFQDGPAQGEAAIEAAALAARHQPNPKVVDGAVWVPFQKVTKANLKTFLTKK